MQNKQVKMKCIDVGLLRSVVRSILLCYKCLCLSILITDTCRMFLLIHRKEVSATESVINVV